MEQTAELGLFWFPSQDSNQFPGTLRYDNDGAIVLTTYESLAGPRIYDLGVDHRSARVICGQIGSQHIKLVTCHEVDQRSTLASRVGHVRESTWNCRFAFRGDYYEGEKPEQVKSAQLRIQSLSEWVPGPARIEFQDKGETSSLFWPTCGREQTCRWSLGGLVLLQSVAADWGSGRHRFDSAVLTTDATLSLAFDSLEPLSSVMDAVTSLQVLLTVCKGTAAEVDRVSVTQAGDQAANVSVDYVSNLRPLGRTVPYSELLTFGEFGGVEGIARWLDILRDQTVLKQGLIIDRYHQPAFTTDRTSHLLVACEVYMRREWNDSERRILNFGKQVLEPMVERAGDAFRQSIGDVQAWTSSVTRIRNYWGVAHFQGYGTEPEDGYGIHPVNQALYTLVILCILSDSGLTDDLRSRVVERMDSPDRVRL